MKTSGSMAQAKQIAAKTFAKTTIGTVVAPCPDPPTKKPPPKPDRPPKPPPKKPVAPTVPCAVLDITATCQHKSGGARTARAGERLQVVPDQTYGHDTVEVLATVQHPCGSHPTSTLGDLTVKNNRHTFQAKPPATAKLWLLSFDPVSTTILCRGCAGPELIHIDAYPSNLFSAEIDLKKVQEKLKTLRRVADEALELVADKFQWKVLEGRAAVEAQWKEHTDHRAFYYYKIGIKFSPLFGGEFKTSLGPSKITNVVGKIPGIGRYVQKVVNWLAKVGVYFRASGGIELDVKWERKSPDAPRYAPSKGLGVGGRIELALGAEAAVLKGDLAKVELETVGAVVASGDPKIDEEGFGVKEFKVEFEGLKGSVKLYFLWGIVDVNETVTFIGAHTWYGPTDLQLYHND